MSSIIPYRVRSFFRKYFTKSEPADWKGNYASWREAQAQCSGYDSATILEKVKTSTIKVKNGEAVYERDSVLFEEVHHSKVVADGIKTILSEKQGRLSVIDFGGSLGSSYFQNRDHFKNAKEVHWTVVEQKHFVDCGKQFIASGSLQFDHTIEEALARNKADVLLLGSVIQYFEKPYELLEKCLAYGFEYIIIDRTAFIEGKKERITVQQVPEYIYKASYPAWFLDEKKFLAAVERKYKLLAQGFSEASPALRLEDKKQVYWKGFFFKKA